MIWKAHPASLCMGPSLGVCICVPSTEPINFEAYREEPCQVKDPKTHKHSVSIVNAFAAVYVGDNLAMMQYPPGEVMPSLASPAAADPNVFSPTDSSP